MNLVLRARATGDQLRPARRPPTRHPRALIRHPHTVQRPRRQQLRQRLRIQPVGLRPRLPDARVTRRDHHHARDVRLDDPRDLPRVAGDLQHHPIVRAQALRKDLQHLRPGRNPPRRPHPAGLGDVISQKSRCTSNPIALYPRSPRRPRRHERTVGKRHRRIRARSATGSVAGAAVKSPGSSPSTK